jgi:hypothetical protein
MPCEGIGGWMASDKPGRELRSLLLGYYQGGRLIIAYGPALPRPRPRRGAAERAIMAQTGHKSLPMVRRYIRLGPSPKEVCQRSLPFKPLFSPSRRQDFAGGKSIIEICFSFNSYNCAKEMGGFATMRYTTIFVASVLCAIAPLLPLQHHNIV